jgi:hypothetical protein
MFSRAEAVFNFNNTTMKELVDNFLKEFLSCPIDQQLEIYQQIKDSFKKELSFKGDQAEKSLFYIKDIYNSEFPAQ